MIHWLLDPCCLDFSCLYFLQLYSCSQFVVSEHCVWKTNTRYDFSFLKFTEDSFETSHVIYAGEISMCTWKVSVFCLYILIYITSLYPLIDWWSLRCPVVVGWQGLKAVFLPVGELCPWCVSLSRSVPALQPVGPLFRVRLGIGCIAWKEDCRTAFASTVSVC